jgi:transcriptional regulator
VNPFRVNHRQSPHLVMATPTGTLLQGTLDLLVLKTLSWGPRHGYAIARWLEDTTEDALQIEEGSLCPALYRMERRGWIEAEWGTSELGKRIKIYSLTRQGRAQLRAETAQWAHFTTAVAKVLGPA